MVLLIIVGLVLIIRWANTGWNYCESRKFVLLKQHDILRKDKEVLYRGLENQSRATAEHQDKFITEISKEINICSGRRTSLEDSKDAMDGALYSVLGHKIDAYEDAIKKFKAINNITDER